MLSVDVAADEVEPGQPPNSAASAGRLGASSGARLNGWADLSAMQASGGNARWFVYSGLFVAVVQGFLYSALAVAPIMLVIPLLQLSLVFRFLFAVLLNPHHEVFGFLVVFGTVVDRHPRGRRPCCAPASHSLLLFPEAERRSCGPARGHQEPSPDAARRIAAPTTPAFTRP
jgi:hypothetical protein